MSGVEAAALTFEVLSTSISAMTQGDIHYTGPSSDIGVTAPGLKDEVRSRLNNDAHVTVGNPLKLETQPAPDSWKRIGVPQYPVVQVPVSIFIDHPWPSSNYKVSFMLVLSGMYGFGADGHQVYDDYEEHWD
jgi:hypothetical protein